MPKHLNTSYYTHNSKKVSQPVSHFAFFYD